MEFSHVRHAISDAFITLPDDIDDAIVLLQCVAPVVRTMLRRVRDHNHATILLHAIEVCPAPFMITEAEPVDLPGPRIVHANPGCTREYGYTVEELIGQTPRILQAEATTLAGRGAIRAELGDRKPVRREMVDYRKDGTRFWNEISIAPVADSTGWFTHWVSVNRNTTERHEAEQKLQELDRDLEIPIDELPGGVQRLRVEPGGTWRSFYTSPALHRCSATRQSNSMPANTMSSSCPSI